MDTTSSSSIGVDVLVTQILEHHGIKGQKWGVRRKNPTPSGPSDVTTMSRPGKRVKVSGGQRHNASEDAIATARAKQIAKKSSSDALSTRELKALVERMNLEQQFSRLQSAEPSNAKKAQSIIKGVLSAGTTINSVIAFANSPAGKLLQDQIKSQFKK